MHKIPSRLNLHLVQSGHEVQVYLCCLLRCCDLLFTSWAALIEVLDVAVCGARRASHQEVWPAAVHQSYRSGAMPWLGEVPSSPIRPWCCEVKRESSPQSHFFCHGRDPRRAVDLRNEISESTLDFECFNIESSLSICQRCNGPLLHARAILMPRSDAHASIKETRQCQW